MLPAIIEQPAAVTFSPAMKARASFLARYANEHTGHADPRMIHYYDRNPESLARNATHALTAYVSGAA